MKISPWAILFLVLCALVLNIHAAGPVASIHASSLFDNWADGSLGTVQLRVSLSEKPAHSGARITVRQTLGERRTDAGQLLQPFVAELILSGEGLDYGIFVQQVATDPTFVLESDDVDISSTQGSLSLHFPKPRLSPSYPYQHSPKSFEAAVEIFRRGNPSVAVSVDYRTEEGTAKAGIDFIPSSGKLDFAPFETKKTILIPTLAGGSQFGREFKVQLTNATSARLEMGEVRVFLYPTLTARDQRIELDSQGNAVLKITLSEPSTNAFTVGFQIADMIEAKLSIPANQTNVQIPLFLPSLDRLTTAILQGGGVYMVHPGAQPILIVPKGAPAQAVVISGGYSEETGTMGFYLKRHGATQEALEVDVETHDLTALGGVDYLGAKERIVFPPGVTNATFEVTILEDTILDPGEYFSVTVTTVPGSAHIPKAGAIGYIADSPDRLPIEISNTYASEMNGDHAIVWTGHPLSFRYWTERGTAEPGKDYQDTSGQFENVEYAEALVSILDDAKVEPVKFFYLVTATLTVPSVTNRTAIYIRDNEIPFPADPTFNAPGGRATLLPDGRIAVLAGRDLIILDADGRAVSTSEAPAEIVHRTQSHPFSLSAFEPSGSVLFSFYDYEWVNGAPILVRIKPDGKLDTEFFPGVQGLWIVGLTVGADGAIYACTSSWGGACQIERLLPNGSPDPLWAIPTVPASFSLVARNDGLLEVWYGPCGKGGCLSIERVMIDRYGAFVGMENSNISKWSAMDSLPDGSAYIGGGGWGMPPGFAFIDPSGQLDERLHAPMDFGWVSFVGRQADGSGIFNNGERLIRMKPHSSENPNVISIYAREAMENPWKMPATIYITRKGDSSKPLTFSLRTIDGSAIAGKDYLPIQQEIQFAAMQVEAEVNVTLIDDRSAEPKESFVVEIGSLSSDAILETNRVTISVHDDEPRVEMRLSRTGDSNVLMLEVNNSLGGTFRLERAANLTGPWTQFGDVPAGGGTFSIPLPRSDSAQFYRAVKD